MDKKTKLTASAIWLLTFFLFACQTGTQQTETETGGKEGVKEEAGAKKEVAAKKEAVPKVERLTVPSGTVLQVRLGDAIDTGKTSEGAAFEGSLAAALVAKGVEVARVGSKVTGKVTNVVSSGRLNKPAELSLVLTSLTPEGGEKTGISTQPWSETGESHKKRNIEMIGGGGGAGALIGALTGGKKGAAIGAAVGAGGGAGVAAATGKKEIVLPVETKLTFKLSAPVTLPAKK